METSRVVARQFSAAKDNEIMELLSVPWARTFENRRLIISHWGYTPRTSLSVTK